GQIERLASEFRVIAPDLRGFGGSLLADGDVDAGVAMDRYMADVWAALDALGATDPVVLVGFSMGGYAAWQGALRTPQRLRGLVLCDTRAVGDSAEAAAGREKLAAAVLAAGDASPALAMLPKLLSAETQERRPDVVAETTAMIERQSPEAIAAALRGMARRDDVRSRLAEIACPCLAIVGSADVISPPDEMRSIVEALPDARLVEAPAGHMAPMENAEAVTEALLEFARARCREA
ncbi:MAG TPA: alpha/beta hydrolase, partial [Lacipirellulaceae bacterium]|nr:alpha/beta hydrolase [Lacipirellulaceae bacterium]